MPQIQRQTHRTNFILKPLWIVRIIFSPKISTPTRVLYKAGPRIQLAWRSCNHFIFTLLQSRTAQKKLSYLDREDLEALMLSRERMTSFVCGEGIHLLGILDISSWLMRWPTSPFWRSGHISWRISTLCSGHPLTTFRLTARTLRHLAGDDNNSHRYYDEVGAYKGEMCGMCMQNGWRLGSMNAV